MKKTVAFFCAEYAIDEDSEMYAGGLGVLAGDMVLEAGDEDFPLVSVGLWYNGPHAIVRQKKFTLIKSGSIFNRKPVTVEIPCGTEKIKAQIWQKTFGKNSKLFLLDTNIEDNKPENRKLLARIYDVDFETRMKQEMILGIGGVRLIKVLGINVDAYHLNEGHTAYAALELKIQKIDKPIIATKHTIFPEAGAWIQEDLFTKMFGPYCTEMGVNQKELFSLGTDQCHFGFSTTHFLLKTSSKQNGVSVLHTKFEKQAHPNSTLIPITNGVYQKRWQAKNFSIELKPVLREELIDFVNSTTGSNLDPKVCTVVWARRFAAYKRPEMIFTNLERLKKITSGAKSDGSNIERPIQFIISGKAHPADIHAQEMVEYIKKLSQDPEWKNRLAYLPDYSIPLSEKLVKGADIWLNTPIRGKEACGTSGMKACLNGTLQMSIDDGWVGEVDWKNIGWILPEENTAQAIYDILENEVAPIFYDHTSIETSGMPKAWADRMRATVSIVEKGFTAKRMLADYIEKMYN